VIVIVDFRAPRRGFCCGFAPVFEAASGRYPDVVFARLDSEAVPELAQEFAIRAIPTPTMFRENVFRFSQAGVLQGAHRAQLADEARKVDVAQVQGDIAAREAEATAPAAG
jgi:thioredoxin 1